VSIDTGILYAMPQATESLLQDSRIDLAAWLVNNVGIAFAQKEAAAFVSGDSIGGKPRGILSVPMETGDDFARSTFFSLQFIGTGSSSPSNVQIADALIATSQKLRPPYRQNAVWLMNRSFSTVVRQLKESILPLAEETRPRLDKAATFRGSRPIAWV
jgi:HK97 family phage major capsid protein